MNCKDCFVCLVYKYPLILVVAKHLIKLSIWKLVMEGKGRVGSSSSSSFTTQLFGPKEPSSSSNFNSIFPPPSKGTERNILSSKHGSLEQRKESSATCNLSSSLYYGGQDVYSRPTNNHTYPTPPGQPREDDGASSRGNWWQGILSNITTPMSFFVCYICLVIPISPLLQVPFTIRIFRSRV